MAMERGFVRLFIQVFFFLNSMIWLFSQENSIKVGDRVIELDDDILFENFDLRIANPVKSSEAFPARDLPPRNRRYEPRRREYNYGDRDVVSNYVLTNIYNSYITNVFIFSNYFALNNQELQQKRAEGGQQSGKITNAQHPINIYLQTNVFNSNAFNDYFRAAVSNLYNESNQYKNFFDKMSYDFQPKRGMSPQNPQQQNPAVGAAPVYNHDFQEIVSNLYFNTNEYNYYYNDFNSNYVMHIKTNEYNYYYNDFYSSYITNNFFNTNEYNYFYSEISSNIYNYSNYSNLYNVSNTFSNTYNNTNDYNFYYTEVFTNTQSNIITNVYNVSNYYGVVVGKGVDAKTLEGAKISEDGKLILPKKKSYSEYVNIPVLLLQARDLARKKSYYQALTLIGMAESREPNNTRMLNMKGSIFYKLQFYDYALEAWGKSLGINSEQPIVEYYYNRAAVLLRTIR